VERRWQLLSVPQESREALLDAPTLDALGQFRGSIENCIGALQLPVGLAGPLRIEGAHAHGDYYLPLATTEAALVASYSRGAQLIAEAGGCAALVLAEGIGRSPGFAFASLREAARFAEWALSQRLVFNGCVAATTSHGRLTASRLHDGRRRRAEYGDTGDRGHLCPHPRRVARPAGLLVSGGELLWRQEGQRSLVRGRARAAGQRGGNGSSGPGAAASAYDA
jgi:hypothetical protein